MVLEIDGADHPEGGVPTSTVVDHFNPASHSLTRSIAGGPALPVVELGLKRRPERLSHRVIETHSGTPHGLSNAQIAAHLPELLAGKLCPTGECPILCVRGLGLQVIRESVGVGHS